MRVCVIDIAGLGLRLLRAQSGLWLESLPCRPQALRATFPALTASIHASMTTGVPPGVHGVIAGGVFRRQAAQVSLCERSNTLLSKKRFWHSRRLPRRPKVALLFWSNPLAGAADYIVGCHTYVPGTHNTPDYPPGLYAEVAQRLGHFDPALLHGPGASWRASQWISRAARHVWRTRKPDLQYVYLPGLNFEIVRHGPDSPQAAAALREIDSLAAELAQDVQEDGSAVIVVSSGTYVPTSRWCSPNLLLRRAGLLKLTEGGRQIDVHQSPAIAMVDHQIAHLFCVDEQAATEAAAAVSADPAVAATPSRDELLAPGLGHDRAGERIALAAPDAWMSFCWWEPHEPPPEVARQFDPTHKCGYDPCELLAPPGPAAPGAIDSAPQRIRASRGLVNVPPQDQCLLAASCDLEAPPDAAGLPEVVRGLLFGRFQEAPA